MITTRQIEDLATELDPSILMEDLDYVPDDWQRKILRSTSRRLLLLASRQVGKSLTTAILGLHGALYSPGALIVLVSPSLRQSGELFRKLTGLYADLGRPVPRESETTTMLALANGSRVVSLPGSPETIRGFSAVHTLIVDEAALVHDSMFAAVSPMLAVSGGRLVLLSSPFGARGYFHDQWEAPGDLWEKISISADQCPRIDPVFLAAERQTLGERAYQQEYFCAFNSALDQVFSTEAVAAAFDADVAPLFGPDRSPTP